MSVIQKIADKWLKTWDAKRSFNSTEKDLVMEFAKFVDKLMEGEDEKA